MKAVSVFTALILALFANVVYSAAIDSSLSSRDVNVTEAADFAEFGDVVAYALPDGRRKIDFYSNGVLDGSAIETEDGATFFEADGTEIDLNESDDKLAKRVSRWRLAIKFAKLIAKYGKKAWNYIYCVGTSAMWRCGDDYLQCSASGIPPWQCAEGIICVGVAARGFQTSYNTVLSFKAARLLTMSDSNHVPGAWNSSWEESSIITHELADAHNPIPPPPLSQSHRRPPPPPPPPQNRPTTPLPPPSQSRRLPPPGSSQSPVESPPHASQSRPEYPPPLWQGRLASLSPPSQSNRAPLPTATQNRPEYPPPNWQGRLAPLPPPSQSRNRVPIPTTSQEPPEYPQPIWQGRFSPPSRPYQIRRGPLSTTAQTGLENEFSSGSSDYESGDSIDYQKKPIVIAVFGKTGTGKTSFINSVTGRDLKVGHGLTSCTDEVHAVSCRIDNENVILVDTPATTMWEKVDMRQGLQRELELRLNFWKDMIDDGSTVARIMTEAGGEARQLVISLLKNKPLSTRLQEELRSGKTLVQTDAGTEVRAVLVELVQKLRRDQAADIADLRHAQQSRKNYLSISLSLGV
ncbi:hypothetical protein V496_02325 [Pseudogymnoascus sp. VKM F-4515 (FW-2607)]|nr:hypothetical protein V496_02325 [Pseudogymnoascus sp. VKM F-4515 (FW-2607)]